MFVSMQFDIVVNSLGEGRVGLYASRAFVVHFVSVTFIFVVFTFSMVSWVDCGLWLWYSLDLAFYFLG